MILQALYKLAERERLIEDPDFEQKPIRFIVNVGRGGELLGISDTQFIPIVHEEGKKPKKGKPQAKVARVPRDSKFNSRTAGNYPGPFFDKADYVFGRLVDPKDQSEKNAQRAIARRELFRERVAAAYHETHDEGVAALLALLDRIAAGFSPELVEDCGPGDLFAFSFAEDRGGLVTDRPAVVGWWKRQRSAPAGGNAPAMQCLVSGEEFTDPDLFPKIKRVPGVAGDISLVSFNQSAFLSYGLQNNENAPVSRAAAEAVATALNRLLHPAYPVPDRDPPTLGQRTFRLSADTGFCYWSLGEGSFENTLFSLFDVDASAVKDELWTRLWRGCAPPEHLDLSPFYGLVITGQTGRAILRDWFETTVGRAQRAVADHFNDLRIVRNAPWKKGEAAPPAIPLRTLLESIAAQGDQENIPPSLAGDFVRAAFTGSLYPMDLLTRAVARARTEAGAVEWADLQRRDARAALIKATLNRKYRKFPSSQFKEVKEDMDATNTHPGYILGALMAVLERLQQEALSDVNASVVDKYFSGASASPRTTFDRLLRNARHHVKKASDGERAGYVFNLERLIDALMIRISVDDHADRRAGRPIGFPVSLPIEEQGLFVIGYHHMRHWLWMSTEERAAWEAANPDAPNAFLWQARKARAAAANKN